MIVVTVELWPFGSEAHKETLAYAKIANDGTGDSDIGNYNVTLFEKDFEARIGRVEQYPRYAYSIWELVRRALTSILGD